MHGAGFREAALPPFHTQTQPGTNTTSRCVKYPANYTCHTIATTTHRLGIETVRVVLVVMPDHIVVLVQQDALILVHKVLLGEALRLPRLPIFK